MKKLIYAVMLLLGLSMTNISCSNSPEAQAKSDAKAVVKALEKNDPKAKEKAWAKFAEHKIYYDNKGEGKRFQDAFDKAAAEAMKH